MTDRQAYVAAVRERAFKGDPGMLLERNLDGDPDLLEWFPGGVVHSFAGAIGADWGADAVVAAIESAHEVAWEPGAFAAHELRVELHDGPRVRVLHFDVPAPADVPAWLTTYRSEGYGKAHAALAGERKARCGASVKEPRAGLLGQPFRPGPSRCASCSALIERDAEAVSAERLPDGGGADTPPSLDT